MVGNCRRNMVAEQSYDFSGGKSLSKFSQTNKKVPFLFLAFILDSKDIEMIQRYSIVQISANSCSNNQLAGIQFVH